MKAKLRSYYRKEGGRKVFVYAVTGTPEELAAYATAQGDNLRKDGETPLFFSVRPLSNNRNAQIPLMITPTGNVVADDLDRELLNAEKLDDYMLREEAKLRAAQALGAGGIAFVSAETAAQPEVKEVVSVDEPVDA